MHSGKLPSSADSAARSPHSDSIRRGEAMLLALREALDKVYPAIDPQPHLLARECCALSGQTSCREPLCGRDRPHASCPYLGEAPVRPAVMPIL